MRLLDMKLLDAPMGTAPSGRRPWLRWLLLAVVVVALAFAFVNLGFWQLDRLDQRRARNNSVLDHETSAPVEFTAVFNRPITEADQWQRVRVRGSFDAEHQFIVRYRSNAGSSGYEIVTPLHASTGEWVVVSRGFVAKPGTQDYPSALPPPPTGEVSILGHVRRDEQGSREATTPAGPGNSVRLINSTGLATALPYPVVNGYVSVLEISAPQSGDLVPVQPPELTEGSHFSYAVQWFMFAGIAGIGLVLLIRSDVRAMRRAAVAPAPGTGEG